MKKRFREVQVVEFKHTDRWSAIAGDADIKRASKIMLDSKELAPGFEYRIVSYVPCRRRESRAPLSKQDGR